jgi:perosamine synthetase
LALIEDACEAIGAEFQGRRAGSFGHIAVLGFYPNKQLTTGEGGAVLASNADHAARLRSLRNQGRNECLQSTGDWLDYCEAGYNYRLSELACALGRVQLGRIGQILELRQTAAESYDALLRGVAGLELPPLTLPQRTISWFVYVVRLPQQADRDQVQGALVRRGIATRCYFAPIPARAWHRWRLLNPSPAVPSPSRSLTAFPCVSRKRWPLPSRTLSAPRNL